MADQIPEDVLMAAKEADMIDRQAPNAVPDDPFTYEISRVEHVFQVCRVDQYDSLPALLGSIFEKVFATWDEALAYRDANTAAPAGSARVQWIGAPDSYHRFSAFQRRKVVAIIRPKEAKP